MLMQTVLIGNPITLQFVVTTSAGALVDATGGVTFTVEPVNSTTQTVLTGVRVSLGTYQYSWQPATAGLYNLYAASLGPNKSDQGQINVVASLVV